jgi:hypothetical protein
MSAPSRPITPPPTSVASNPASPIATPAAGAVPEPAPIPVSKLTPEEQMAAFEKELKENDWGHQPC